MTTRLTAQSALSLLYAKQLIPAIKEALQQGRSWGEVAQIVSEAGLVGQASSSWTLLHAAYLDAVIDTLRKMRPKRQYWTLVERLDFVVDLEGEKERVQTFVKACVDRFRDRMPGEIRAYLDTIDLYHDGKTDEHAWREAAGRIHEVVTGTGYYERLSPAGALIHLATGGGYLMAGEDLCVLMQVVLQDCDDADLPEDAVCELLISAFPELMLNPVGEQRTDPASPDT